MRILFACSEAYPLAKTGGLADASAALAASLSELGHDVRLLMPGYDGALERSLTRIQAADLGDVGGIAEATLVEGLTPDRGLPVYLVDSPDLYRRAGGLYCGPDGQEWPDNARRFALLSHVAARIAAGTAGLGWRPDVVHAHDWHLGPAVAMIASQRGRRPATVFTIHNLAFQGNFPIDAFPLLGLPGELLSADGIEFYGQVSFLKAGIRYADRLTTVSPSYAREILTPEFGCGMEGLLQARAADLVGILNGVDYAAWSPEGGREIAAAYDGRDLSGKAACKTALQGELGLAPDAGRPLIGFVSRLTEQKMADVLPEIAPQALAQGAQLAIVGEGDRRIETALGRLTAAHGGRAAVRIGYDDALARRVLAGADALLAPARWEPCGLTQMYAMRYGALPIVRRVGGLADTVTGPRHADDAESTGFVFEAASADALAGAIDQACGAYRRPIAWRKMQLRAMARDFGWARSAERYAALYGQLAPEAARRRPANDAAAPCAAARDAAA